MISVDSFFLYLYGILKILLIFQNKLFRNFSSFNFIQKEILCIIFYYCFNKQNLKL